MQTKYKRGQKVRLLIDPDPEYVEYHTEISEEETVPIKKGMVGEVNLILPNGRYHVRVLDQHGKEFAYVMIDEDYLEPL